MLSIVIVLSSAFKQRSLYSQRFEILRAVYRLGADDGGVKVAFEPGHRSSELWLAFPHFHYLVQLGGIVKRVAALVTRRIRILAVVHGVGDAL